MGIEFANNEWHHQTQWLLNAHDVDKDDMRTFALKDIHSWTPGHVSDVEQRMHGAIVKQLQRSMERNARMVNRLKALLERCELNYSFSEPVDLYDARADIEAILNDREP